MECCADMPGKAVATFKLFITCLRACLHMPVTLMTSFMTLRGHV